MPHVSVDIQTDESITDSCELLRRSLELRPQMSLASPKEITGMEPVLTRLDRKEAYIISHTSKSSRGSPVISLASASTRTGLSPINTAFCFGIDAYKSGLCTSINWHSSANQIRTKGGTVGSELVRWLIALSQAAFSGSLDVQPSGLKVTTDPSMWRQVKLKFTTVHS